MLEQPMFI